MDSCISLGKPEVSARDPRAALLPKLCKLSSMVPGDRENASAQGPEQGLGRRQEEGGRWIKTSMKKS